MSAVISQRRPMCVSSSSSKFPDHPERWRAYLKAAELLRKQQAYTDAVRVLEDGLLVAVRTTRARDRMQLFDGVAPATVGPRHGGP